MKKALVLIIPILLFVGCGDDDQTEKGTPVVATATIFWVNSEDGEIFEAADQIGQASFSYVNGVTTLNLSVADMEPNTSHAMHIHQGTLEEPGRHWNQGKFVAFCEVESLGRLWLKPFAGDVGNIQIDEDGNGTFTIETNLWSVGTGDDSDILDNVLFIHHKSEDFAKECDPNHTHEPGGHTNAKIAGGVITIAPTLFD